MELVARPFPKRIADETGDVFGGLFPDVVLGDCVTAVGTDGTVKVTCRLGLDGGLERFACALRALKRLYLDMKPSPPLPSIRPSSEESSFSRKLSACARGAIRAHSGHRG